MPPDSSTALLDSETQDQAATKDAVASRWRLVWRRFRKHKLAMVGLIVTIGVYVVAVFGAMIAPYGSSQLDADYTYAPPQQLHIVDASGDSWDWGLYVHGYTMERDPETLEQEFTTDPDNKVPVGLFVQGDEYELFGLIPWDRHLIGPVDSDTPMYLLGADQLGRDQLSRIIHGTAISMSVGLVGVGMGFVLGILLGGISGYFGGRVDTIIQRAVELFMSLPTLPLWLGLAAAVPREWDSVQRYFAITLVLSLVAWTSLARDVRGRFLALREEDFVTSARLDGTKEPRIIFGHILPSFTSHLIATLTLAIPTMILAETALSFLGLGLQPPTVSWGVLLQEAQNIRVISTAPWLLLPGVAVVVAVLAMNFLGDGLRDAADPYKH
ncbi:ABC transporter permease [Ruania alba]|uniref:Peptide/nickel transport system permease protein n=1 Tax=Ruania alba TaxID=648782 RepID=A0A1H5BNK1_9MICO|nr:ABC transporter permease [Ruania alba]SED55550.1 peptide/nickel transport system permease protein [Ruania alba]